MDYLAAEELDPTEDEELDEGILGEVEEEEYDEGLDDYDDSNEEDEDEE